MSPMIVNPSNGWIRLVAGALVIVLAIWSPSHGQETHEAGKAIRVTRLTEDGGHLAWHPQEDLVAFDRMNGEGYFQPWLMHPSR